jgi:hypothetical protein
MRTGAHRKTSSAEIHAKVARSGYVDVLFLFLESLSRDRNGRQLQAAAASLSIGSVIDRSTIDNDPLG